MGRGRLLRTILREQRKRIENAFKTRLKLYKKHPQVWIGERLADIAKKTGVTDVAKIVALVGMTILIKKIIDTTEELKVAIQQPFFVVGGKKGTYQWKGPFTYELVPKNLIEAFREGIFPDWIDWLIAFSLAYLIIEHFGDIMQTAGNVTSSLRGLLSGLLVGGGVAS